MSKHFTFSLMGLLLVVFAAYILIAGTPLERINHTCSPIAWAGKVVTAASEIASDNAAKATWRGTANTFQACRFVMFRTFYAGEYARIQEQAEAAKRSAAASKAGPSGSAPIKHRPSSSARPAKTAGAA